MTGRMRLLLCICTVVGLSAGIGTGVAVYLQPEPVLLACPDVTPIPETRVVTLLEAWPVPPEATPIPAPRRAVRRSKPPSLIAAPVPVEQCAPDRLSSVPGGDAGPNEVPEPSSAAVSVLGLMVLAAVRRRSKAPK